MPQPELDIAVVITTCKMAQPLSRAMKAKAGKGRNGLAFDLSP